MIILCNCTNRERTGSSDRPNDDLYRGPKLGAVERRTIMKLFNDQAAAAVASLDSADAAYCAKLEQRFAHMGISSKAASSAVQSLVEADAVPQVGVWAALPSAFKGLFQKKTEVKPVASDRRSGFSVRSARLGSSQQTPPLRRMVPPLRRPRAAALASAACPLACRVTDSQALPAANFPPRAASVFPKRKATPPKLGGVASSNASFRSKSRSGVGGGAPRAVH